MPSDFSHGKFHGRLFLSLTQRRKRRLFHPNRYIFEVGIEKGRLSFKNSRPKRDIYKIICCSDAPKPLILLGFSKSSVSPLVPNQYNPDLFPIGDGCGLFVFFDRYETTYFRNGVKRKPTSKPRGLRKKKQTP